MRVISPRGEYADRRAAAKAAGAAVHLQLHFNSGGGAYSLMEVTSAADSRCGMLAKVLADDAARLFGIRTAQVKSLARGDRGWVCIGDETPGIVLEPFFGDVAAQAKIAHTSAAQEGWAQVIAERIKGIYPPNAVICITLGHKYKTSNPTDRGASLLGGSNEADWNEPVLNRVVQLLSEGEDTEVIDSKLFFVNDPDAAKMTHLRLLLNSSRFKDSTRQPDANNIRFESRNTALGDANALLKQVGPAKVQTVDVPTGTWRTDGTYTY